MAEGFNFEFKFEHRKDSMSQLLVDNRIATCEFDKKNEAYLKINLKNLCPEIYNSINKERLAAGKSMIEHFNINYKADGSLQYYSVWAMDETILNAVSRYFKDDLLYVFAFYTP